MGGGSASWLQQIMHPNTDALRGLHHAAVEVELPDYHRLHGGDDNSSPPDFFRGESSKWGAITDLDRFFERVYQYYCDKGFWCIVTQWLVELLTLGFTISFSGFLLLFVNWPGLLNAKCGIDAIDEGNTHNCDLAKEALHKHPLTPFTFLKGIICIYLILFSMYWIFCFVRFFTQLQETLEVGGFCHNRYRHQMFCYMCFRTVIIVPLGRVVRIRFYSGFCPLAKIHAA
jgi:autophagy-related protein 9